MATDVSLHFTMPGLQQHIVSVTLLVIFTPTFSRADSDDSVISCYQCHSKYNENCEILSLNSSIYNKPCNDSIKYEGQTPFCRKITQTIHGHEGKEVIVRKCGWVQHEQDCYRVRNWDHSETVCQCFTDGCNFGSTIPCSLVLSLLPLIVPLVVKWQN